MATTQGLATGYAEVHAFLHTVRCIQQHETQLCTLLQAIKRDGKMSPTVRKDLSKLLGEMPGPEYAAELHALQQVLE